MEDISCDEEKKGRDILPSFHSRRVYIRSFGCALNHADSLRMEALIRAQGAFVVGEDQANTVIVNTCTVIKKTERAVLRFLRKHADKEIFVMGCMAAIQNSDIHNACQRVSILSPLLDTSGIPLGVRVNEAIGLVPIARGCLGNCTYCVAQKARGRLYSESEVEICSAIIELLHAGVREIQLTAQDVSGWGLDRDQTLPSLIQTILSLPGSFRLRTGMMNPATLIPIINDLLPLYRHQKMYAFAHIPVQSGSDRVLEAMGRKYKARDFLDLIGAFRQIDPLIWIATDVIVGFPGETDEEFADTLKLIREIRPDKVNITRFSPRPATVAATLPDMLERTKKERSRELSRLAEQISLENHRLWLDKELTAVVVERIKPGSVVCRTPQYRSIVLKEDLALRSEVNLRITGARTHYLIGQRVS